MPGKNGAKLTRYLIIGAAVVFVGAATLLGGGLAVGAMSEAAVTGDDTVSAAPPAGMAGDPIAQPVTMPSDPQQAALIKRGEYLAVAGDCQECHSISGKPAYSGGQYLGSPVGAVFSPNISPSKQYGTGNWTDADFWNALHYGIEPGSSLLVFPKYMLPSMPYDATSKLSYSDVMALKAYLQSIQPAEIPNRVGQIPFPFDIRAALLGWRLLFFHIQPVQDQPGWSASVRNGAYLVQALAHCSDCHTPRNILFGSETDKFLGGGHILAQSWYAPNITSQKDGGGIGSWSSADLVQYLGGAGTVGVGAPYGPMQQVVDDSLSRLPKSDVQDIANYLQQGTNPLPSPALVANSGAPAIDGGAIYADHCARCHGANGEGVNNNFPNLAANQSVWDGPANNIIAMVIGGFSPWHPDQSPMPNFRNTLTDDQIAAVSNYVRTSWGNKGVADATGAQVASLRSVTDTMVDLNTGSTQATYAAPGGPQAYDDISGSLQIDGKFLNCMLQAHFSAADPAAAAQTIELGGACADGGGTLIGQAVVNGQTVPVDLQLRTLSENGKVTALDLSGPVGGVALHAQINLVTLADGTKLD